MQLTPEEEQKLEEVCQLSFDFARNNDAQSLQILLDNGMNVNLSNHKGNTLLMLASYHNSIDCVKLLLKHKADVNKVNDKNLTPLSGVCYKGYTEVAKLLLEAGADPDKTNGMGLSSVDFAVMFRRKDILQLLEQYSQKKIGFLKRFWAGLGFSKNHTD